MPREALVSATKQSKGGFAMKYKIWDRIEEPLITPVGEVLSKEDVFERYPASRLETMKYIICDSPIQLGVFMEFNATKEHYKEMGANITDDMTDQEVLDAITEFEQMPPDPEPTAEERIEELEQESITSMLALVSVYEDNLRLEQENTSVMLALTELYEMMIGG